MRRALGDPGTSWHRRQVAASWVRAWHGATPQQWQFRFTSGFYPGFFPFFFFFLTMRGQLRQFVVLFFALQYFTSGRCGPRAGLLRAIAKRGSSASEQPVTKSSSRLALFFFLFLARVMQDRATLDDYSPQLHCPSANSNAAVSSTQGGYTYSYT